MSAAFAPSPWPPSPPSSSSARVPGGEAASVRGSVGPSGARQWLLKRNCSFSPAQLAQVYGSLCVVSLLIGVFFLVQGAPLVLAFAGVELLAVGAALLVFARHATDREMLTLVDGSLHVEQCSGGQVVNTRLASDWVTVEPVAAQGSLVQLSSRGRTLRVGRFLRAELRPAFARELRQALRAHALRRPMAAVQAPTTAPAPGAAPSESAESEPK